MSTKPLILLTGANGFLGTHVVDQLVRGGYRVRGTVRTHRFAAFQENFREYGEDLDLVVFDHIAHDDFSEALKDVYAVIHNAAPVPGRATSLEEQLEATIDGTTNILRQSEEHGVRRFIYIGSATTYRTLDREWSDDDWGDAASREDAIASGNDALVYITSKIIAEQAVWKFAEEHPNIDITSLNPSSFVGPFAPAFRFTDLSLTQLSTNLLMHALLRPDGVPFQPFSFPVDVRDVAHASIQAITAPPEAEAGRKRIFLSSQWASWRTVVEAVAEARPALKARLSEEAWDLTYLVDPMPKTCARAHEVLGMEPRPWLECVLAAVDAVIELEERLIPEGKEWHHEGREMIMGGRLRTD